MRTSRTPLRYPGGKTRWAKRIVESLDSFERYVEPFVGGGSVFLEYSNSFPKTDCWINDGYEPVFLFWKQIKTNGTEVVADVRRIASKYSDGKSLYADLKAGEDLGISAAARFFILNRITFSGLANSGGYSEQAFRHRFTENAIARLADLAHHFPKNVEVTNSDFSLVLEKVGVHDIVFLDPPYLSAEPSKLYGRGGSMHIDFTHGKLASALRDARYKWFMTYDDDDEIRATYADFAHIVPWRQHYSMSNHGAGPGRQGLELILTNDIEMAERAKRSFSFA